MVELDKHIAGVMVGASSDAFTYAYFVHLSFLSELLKFLYLSSSRVFFAMASIGLVVALVFSAIFGAALLWLAIYYVHRYIHQQCLQLEHWFHVLTPRHASWNTCHHEKHTGHDSATRSRSKSARREENRDRSEYRKVRRGYQTQAGDEGPVHLRMEQTRPIVQIDAPAHPQSYGQHYYPPLQWQYQMPERGQVGIQPPTMYPQISPFAPQQVVPHISYPQPAIPGRNAYRRPLQRIYPEAAPNAPKVNHLERSTEKPISSTSPRRVRQVNKVDYIHICDEYPPIILEALKTGPATATSTPSLSSPSTSTATQEVPRAPIPRARPRFDDVPTSQGNQYQHRNWNAQTSVPQPASQQ